MRRYHITNQMAANIPKFNLLCSKMYFSSIQFIIKYFMYFSLRVEYYEYVLYSGGMYIHLVFKHTKTNRYWEHSEETKFPHGARYHRMLKRHV
jgi:hypothetical protein